MPKLGARPIVVYCSIWRSPSELPAARPLADVALDTDWLAVLVIDHVDLGQLDEQRRAVMHFELHLQAAADKLLGRDAVHALRPWAHELDAAARDDECLESVRAQVCEQLQHRLIDHFRLEPARPRMSGCCDPLPDGVVEFIGSHAGMRRCHQLHQAFHARCGDGFHIALEQRGEWLPRFPFGMLGREGLHTI